MALVSFGGGGDPSGIFASLNRQFLNDIEALAERASNRAERASDAKDRDMFDQWQNGLIDDDAWLEYISQRVQETADDPEEHQQWVETQREYESSIADSKMEFAYENGDATINQLIDYYRSRRDRLDPDSQAYRDIVLKLNGFVDKQLGDDIQAGAQDITDRIVMGSATLGDLISFYQQRLKGLRPNSSLYEQITQEIRDLQSRQIEQGASGVGGGSGGGRSSGGRRSSGGGSASYGSTYDQYSAATASGMVPKNEVVAAALYERDNLGVSPQARQFSGTLPGMTEAESDDFIQGARSHAKFMMDQFGDPDSDSIIYDPQTGQEWENTTENMRRWAYEYIDLSEMRARGQETGNKQDFSNMSGARNDIVEAVRNVQKANAIPFEENMHTLDSEYRRQLRLAESSGDPENIMAVNTAFGREFERLGYNAISTPARDRKATRRDAAARDEFTPKPQTPRLRDALSRVPESLAEEAVARGQLLRAYGRGDPTEIIAAQTAYVAIEDHDPDLVDTSIDIWDDMDNGVLPTGDSPASLALIAARMRDGEREGTWMRVYDADNAGDGIAIVPRAVTQSFDPMTGEHVGHAMPRVGNFNPENGDRWEQIYTDDRNGNPVLTWVISREEPLPLNTFVAGTGLIINGQKIQAGTKLTANLIRQIGGDQAIKRKLDLGQVVTGPAGMVRTYTYKYGNQYVKAYWDNDLQGWSATPYNRYGLQIKSVNGVPTVVLDDDGTLGGNLRPFAHLNVRPINYHGKNAQKFQEMINSGEITPPMGWGYRVNASGEIEIDRENDFRDYWYDERYVTRRTGLWLNGQLVQWADPSFKTERTEDEKRNLLRESTRFDPKDRSKRQDPYERLARGGAETVFGGLIGGIGGLLEGLGIFQGDPSRQDLPARSRAGSFGNEGTKNLGFLADNALARVKEAQAKRALEESARQALPRITLPRTVGPIMERVDLPSVPRTAPVIPTAPRPVTKVVSSGGVKRVSRTAAPAPAPRTTPVRRPTQRIL